MTCAISATRSRSPRDRITADAGGREHPAVCRERVGAPEHEAAKAWLEEALNGSRRVGFPWESLTAFVRLAPNPRVLPRPIGADDAWAVVEGWLASPDARVPVPTERHAAVLGDLVRRYRPTGRHVPDAHLAALAIEYGAEVVSADTDFARYAEIRWRDPLAE